MKEDCTLIATLPSMNCLDNVRDAFSRPEISEVRFNTGSVSPYSPHETVKILKELSCEYGKKLWVDLKGRQLRVTEWGNPLFSCIKINHKINVENGARIYLRNGECCRIMHIEDGNKLYVDPLPRHAVGAGQSVNIMSKSLKIHGYLTEQDEQYIDACGKEGIKSFFLSFAEQEDDIAQVMKQIPDAEVVLKIESEGGMRLMERMVPGARYMAARDDLYIQTGTGMMEKLHRIIQKDEGAICASRIFLSLEKSNTPEFCDYTDLELMYRMGYRNFMLCDNVCNHALRPALDVWNKWLSI